MSALSAAQQIWEDITLRSGIGNEAEAMPQALRSEVMEIWAEIIAAETAEAFQHIVDYHERVLQE